MSFPFTRTAILVLQRKRVARSRSLANPEAVTDGSQNEFSCRPNGFLGPLARRHFGSDCRGQNATGSVCIGRMNPAGLKMQEIGSIEQNIGNLIARHVSALDQYRPGAHPVNLKSSFFDVRKGCHSFAGEYSGFLDIGRDHEREWKKRAAERAERIPAEQRSAGCRS